MKNVRLLFIFLLFAPKAFGQKPPMLNSYHEYRQAVLQDPSKQMTELKEIIPSVVYDLKYATTNNFMKRRMYPRGTSVTFLRKDAALALAKVQQELHTKGLGIKIFDAYRPWSVSKNFWDLVQDETYVANPARGSNHNRGTAVDLTLIDFKTGEELNLGTGFDNFTDSAHHSFKSLPQPVLQNRGLLKAVMEKYGFVAYNEEWWHYTFKSDVKFEVLNVPFRKLKRR